jgi:outer membrane protein assembly factor BamA
MRAATALLILLCATSVAAQSEERIVEIRVHGNHTTPEADVLAVSGLAVGDEASETRLKAAEQQLLSSRRFEGAEVRRRFLSIEDPTKILVMIVVDEREGVAAGTPMPGLMRRLRLSSLWMPILDYTDGYGFTWGARISFVDPLGPRTRISVPLTWGGDRRAAFEVERTFDSGPLTLVSGAVSTYRRENPHFDIPDVRFETSGRIERRFTPWLRLGASARAARVDFAGVEEWHQAGGADVTFDTRIDPSFPRNAIHATVGWERLAFEGGSAGRWSGDIRGYASVFRSNVLALRAQFDRASAPLPPSEQPFIGGADSVRGYRTGYRAGDSTAAVSAELRVPLSSPLNFGRFGAKGFIDAGTTWLSSERLRNQQFDHGIGGGIYMGVAAFMLNVDVAWAESGSARWHVGLGVTF